MVEPSTPLKWFFETEAKERIDLSTVDYATQSVVCAVSGNMLANIACFQETFDKLSWLPEASGPVITFTLVVKNFTKELAGKYSCEAYDGEKKVISREYVLKVDGELLSYRIPSNSPNRAPGRLPLCVTGTHDLHLEGQSSV